MKFGRKITRTKWIFKIKKFVTTRHNIVDSWVHAQVAATAAPTLAVVTTVVVPREGRRDALTVTLMVSALRARPGTTSPATSVTSAEVGKQVLLVPRVPVPV